MKALHLLIKAFGAHAVRNAVYGQDHRFHPDAHVALEQLWRRFAFTSCRLAG